MTRPANARVAGTTFLVYIAAGMAGLLRAAPLLRIVLSLTVAMSAFVLGVTLYAITRDEDSDIALLALTCRVAEGIVGTMLISARLALQSLETAPDRVDAAAMHTLGAFVLGARGWNVLVGATFFAVGSTLFSWLLLHGRIVPASLAWMGVVASTLLVVGLPLQLGGVLTGVVTQVMWIPMIAFEVPVGLWLLVYGGRLARPPSRAY